MRKHAPALIVTALFALSSSSAFAMGDRHKEKKATSDTTTTAPATTSPGSSYSAPSSTTPPGTSTSMKTDSTGSPTGATSTSGSASTAAADTSDKRKQVARNDAKCDASKVARESMPKDCFEKPGTGAAAVGSTQGQSGK